MTITISAKKASLCSTDVSWALTSLYLRALTRKMKTFHFCVIALDKNRKEGIDTKGRVFEYNIKDISDYFVLAREQDFFVTCLLY